MSRPTTRPTTRRGLLRAALPKLQEHVLLDEHRVVHVRGTRAPLRPGQPIQVGVVGFGHMGGGHTDGLLRARDAGDAKLDVVAVAEVCEPRREKGLALLRERQPGVEVTGHVDYLELYERPDIHAVLIATPEHWHATHAVHAIEYGKDVYVEKPMTLELEEAFWLAHVARSSDSIVQVGTQWLMHPRFVQARKIVAEGSLGVCLSSLIAFGRNSREGEWLYEIDESLEPGPRLDWERWCGPLGPRAWDTEIYHRWRRYREYSTGIIGDILSHLIAPLLLAVDEGLPVRVTAQGSHMVDTAMENHDQIVGHIEFESGHVMTVIGSTCNDRGTPWMIRGNRADLLLGHGSAEVVPQAAWSDLDDEPRKYDRPAKDIQQQLRLDWLRSVRTRRPNRSNVELGLAHMIVVDLMTRSVWSGRAWRFDPVTSRVFAE
ncbi:putative oxidoreductase YvaA [Planctomycetes bacterium Pla163]|uniref:Putative oxidoreductase YvaA n=1 Tax=Rohdeia mirabilis TaxID=2528008 RepID=A0A518CY56_9BACT|nr:putative oxidoreductase YvaA [Planctomycetes bacterium Pla163]